MKRSPDSQINASFIDILRIKWQVLLLWSSFFRTTIPLASSEATAYYRPAPGRTDGIPERAQRPRDNGYKSVFTNSWLVRQRHRSWILKGLGKKSTKRVNSFIACRAFCPGSPNRDPRDSEKWWHVYTSIAMMARHAWRVYKSSSKTHKNRNACIDAHRSAIPTIICGLIWHPMRTG